MRLSLSLARDIAHYASSCIEQYDVHIQQLAVTKFLGHSKMKGMIPPFLRDLETMKLQDSVMSNMRDGLKDHLVGVHQSKIVMAKDILYTLATNSVVGSRRGLAGILGVDRGNILQARSRRFGLDNSNDAFWLHYRHKIQTDKLAENVQAAVEQWWCNETTVSPNRKDIVSFHKGLTQ
jgi:hypothetical protein